MRRIISSLLFLTLAANGLACACPAESSATGDSHHEKHAEFEPKSNDCHGDDCNGDCGSLDIDQSNRSSVAITNVLPQQDDEWKFSLLAALSPLSIWPSGPPARFSQPDLARHDKHHSPVTLKDRMLD